MEKNQPFSVLLAWLRLPAHCDGYPLSEAGFMGDIVFPSG
jgi:hypothetical protein